MIDFRRHPPKEPAMNRNAPILNLADTPLEAHGKGENFSAMLGRVGATLGTRQIGCTLVVLEPGKRAWPYHLHHAEEEVFVVLDGEGTLRYDDEEFPLRAGDVVLTPPGPGTAHQIINTSEREMRYLALSGKRDPEVCYYPDSGKYGAYFGERREGRFIARGSSSVDYWEGEPVDQAPTPSSESDR